jgi:hypothetical protein
MIEDKEGDLIFESNESFGKQIQRKKKILNEEWDGCSMKMQLEKRISSF